MAPNNASLSVVKYNEITISQNFIRIVKTSYDNRVALLEN